MSRGWARLLVLVLPLWTGCSALTVKSSAGAIIAMDLAGFQSTPLGSHIEIWARNQYNDIYRLNFLNNNNNQYGLQVRLAADPADPCMIDEYGHLLSTPEAYPSTVRIQDADGKVTVQTPAQQAVQFQNRLKQLNLPDEPSALFAVAPYVDEASAPRPDRDADPSTPAIKRLSDCKAYWAKGPETYTGNPALLPAPQHGQVYGFVAFQTLTPPATTSGLRLDTPIKLRGIQELWLTQTTEPLGTVTQQTQGTVLMGATPNRGGRDIVHFDFASSVPGLSGQASVITDTEDSPVQF